ncbi:hypothetical protein BIW11_03804 [Tropilaelaps mercedesae]|uniref:Uncharacterized protein n=1 Tax=Tropilaelaps mercedesae TaxID=418985 RepID=A0A1V9XFB8_9ACAR|nr:hypothetical protein BIW11_03804 [Tropilaelaps mercedesae]
MDICVCMCCVLNLTQDELPLRVTLFPPHVLRGLGTEACNDILSLLVDFKESARGHEDEAFISLCPLCLEDRGAFYFATDPHLIPCPNIRGYPRLHALLFVGYTMRLKGTPPIILVFVGRNEVRQHLISAEHKVREAKLIVEC